MPEFKLWRIKELALKKNLSIRKLGQKAGLSDSAVHEMIKRNAANILNIQKLATALEVDISELVILEDLIMPSDRDRRNVGESIRLLNEVTSNIKTSGVLQRNSAEGMIPLLTFEMMAETKLTELLGSGESVKKYLIPNIPDADFLLTMPGYAMEGDFNPGDTLICKHIGKDQADKIEYGRAYILETEGGFVIRRVMPHKDTAKIICSSPNIKYPAFDIDKKTVLSYSKILGFIRVE